MLILVPFVWVSRRCIKRRLEFDLEEPIISERNLETTMNLMNGTRTSVSAQCIRV